MRARKGLLPSTGKPNPKWGGCFWEEGVGWRASKFAKFCKISGEKDAICVSGGATPAHGNVTDRFWAGSLKDAMLSAPIEY